MICSPTHKGCLMGVRPYRRDTAGDLPSASAWAPFARPGLVARVTRVRGKEKQQGVSPFFLILIGLARVTRVTRVVRTPPVLRPRRKRDLSTWGNSGLEPYSGSGNQLSKTHWPLSSPSSPWSCAKFHAAISITTLKATTDLQLRLRQRR
jgi:hypothetical protein